MGLRYALFAALVAVARAADGDSENCPTSLTAASCYSGKGAKELVLNCPTEGELIKKIVGSVYSMDQGNDPDKCSDTFAKANIECAGSVAATCCTTKIKDIDLLCTEGDGQEFCTITPELAAKAIKAAEFPATCANETLLDLHVECDAPPLDLGPIFAICLVFVISMSLGTTVEIDDFKQIFGEKKKAALIGFCSQFGFMPLMSWGMCQIFGFDARVATGLIVTGCAPGGTTSNLLTYYAKGNVALSFAMSAASTLCALFMVPLLYFLYVKLTYDGETVAMPVSTILFFLIGTLIVPCAIGILVRIKGPQTPIGCGCTKRPLYKWVEKIGATLGIIFLALALVTGIQDNPQLITGVDLYWREWICALLFQPMGSLFGYVLAQVSGLDGPDSRAVCIETGVQNFTLVIGLLAVGTVGCERTLTLRCVYLTTMCYVVNSAWITFLLSKITRDLPDEAKGQELEDPKE